MDSLTFQNNFTCFVTPQWQAKTCSVGKITLLRKWHSPGGGGLCGGWSGRGRLGTERDLLGERWWRSPPRSSSCFRSARAVSSGEITEKVYQILDRGKAPNLEAPFVLFCSPECLPPQEPSILYVKRLFLFLLFQHLSALPLTKRLPAFDFRVTGHLVTLAAFQRQISATGTSQTVTCSHEKAPHAQFPAPPS